MKANVLAMLGCLFMCAGAAAQQEKALDAPARGEVIDALVREMDAHYVFPEVAGRVAATLRQKQKDGGYDALATPDAFASALTADLRQSARDLHLRVKSSTAATAPEPAPQLQLQPTAEQEAAMAALIKADNYGIGGAHTLPGNVAYIELRGFARAKHSEPALAAAMSTLAGAEALIVDLRRNGGGDPQAVAFVSSYLFDKRTHLNDLYWRTEDRTEQFWTSHSVPGKKFGQRKPVYVLTSARTFSGAEEFAYNLKALKRAVIVGEVTGGGAHPGRMRWLTPHFSAFIPNGRAINPVTKTNWEGSGVAPDVVLPAADALPAAHKLALKSLGAAATNPRRKAALAAALAAAEAPAPR